MRLKILAALLPLIVLLPAPSHGQTQTIVLKSGNAAVGAADPQIWVQGMAFNVWAPIPNSGAPLQHPIVVATPSYWGDIDGGAHWVVPGPPDADTQNGYEYYTDFSLPDNVKTASLDIAWRADDGSGVEMNGSVLPLAVGLKTCESEGGPTCQSVVHEQADISPFVRSGSNRLSFVVQNLGGPTGVDYFATINYTTSAASTTPTTTVPAAGAISCGQYATPTPASQPARLAVGSDGNIWFTEGAGNKVGRLTPGGVVTEYSIPTPESNPQGICADVNGGLWFTEEGAGQIGRIATNGSIKEFALPDAKSQPADICLGYDGSLWFTEAGTNAIGRITPNGSLKQYLLPNPNAGLGFITAGWDANLWFTEGSGNRIGRITPDGNVSVFDLPHANSEPTVITTGPEGRLWFTETLGNRIGRMNTDGSLAEFDVPTPGAMVNGISVGPDGSMWFTEMASGMLGRVTLDGVVSEFTGLAASSGPAGITAAPDGNLYTAESGGSQIGVCRFTDTSPSVQVTAIPGQYVVVHMQLSGLRGATFVHGVALAHGPKGLVHFQRPITGLGSHQGLTVTAQTGWLYGVDVYLSANTPLTVDNYTVQSAFRIPPDAADGDRYTFGWTQLAGLNLDNGAVPVTGNQEVVTVHPLKGDLNGDGRVTTADAVVALRIALGLLSPVSPQMLAAADVAPKKTDGTYGDGVVDIKDVTRILRRAVGLEPDPWP